MREIKVRAWDKIQKKYIPASVFNEYINFNNGLLIFEGNGRIIFEQYTGLTDKNGKEIYEGDLCNCHIFTQELGENMGVREGEREFLCEINFGTEGVTLKTNNEDSGPIWAYDGFHEESLEIIGNIHENPALLT